MKAEFGQVEEKELERLVAKWTGHMRWRADFDEWRRRRLRQEDWQAKRIRSLEELCGPLEGKRLLECGCGMGGLAVALLRRGALVQAFDFNPEYCRISKLRGRRYGLDLGIANAAGEAIPFASGTFDVATCLDVLEHVQNPVSVLDELARVLRPGGVAIVTATNRLAFRDPHYHVRGVNWLPRKLADRLVAILGRSKAGSKFSDRQSLSEMHYFTYCAFRRACAQAGFDAADAREYRLRRKAPGDPGARQGPARITRVVPGAWLAYRAYRAFVMGTFEVRLRKKG